jgi:hypothetical protein
MILSQWRHKPRGGFRGYVNVTLSLGLVIPDVRIFVGQHGPFTSLPETPVLINGKVKRDVNNKPVFVPQLKWKNREIADKFSVAVIRELVKRHPQRLGRRSEAMTDVSMIDRTADRINEMYRTGQTSPEAVRCLISEFSEAPLSFWSVAHGIASFPGRRIELLELLHTCALLVDAPLPRA